jgi:hypothetical protein
MEVCLSSHTSGAKRPSLQMSVIFTSVQLSTLIPTTSLHGYLVPFYYNGDIGRIGTDGAGSGGYFATIPKLKDLYACRSLCSATFHHGVYTETEYLQGTSLAGTGPPLRPIPPCATNHKPISTWGGGLWLATLMKLSNIALLPSNLIGHGCTRSQFQTHHSAKWRLIVQGSKFGVNPPCQTIQTDPPKPKDAVHVVKSNPKDYVHGMYSAVERPS